MIDCSFCGKKIEKDRHNFWLQLERQDIVPSGLWQTNILHAREDACAKCFTKIERYLKVFLFLLRKHKGEIPKEG
jgi:hypothetical protein